MPQFATLQDAEKALVELQAKLAALQQENKDLTEGKDTLSYADDYVTDKGEHRKMLQISPKGKRPFKMSEGKFLTLMENAENWLALYEAL